MSYFGTFKGLITDTVARIVRIDASTGALEIIDDAHHEIHGGSHFTYSQVDTDFDITDAVELLIVTPDTTKWPHMVFIVTGALDTTVELYEGATHTILAAQAAFNNNRNVVTANTTTINTHNNDGADGTLIWTEVFGVSSGGGPNAVVDGGSSRGRRPGWQPRRLIARSWNCCMVGTTATASTATCERLSPRWETPPPSCWG